MTDDLMRLADAVFETPARRSPDGGQVPDSVAGAATGGPVLDVRAGGEPGAATFTLPPTPELPRFLTPAELVKAVRRAR